MQLTKKESITSLELLKEINIFREKERNENQNDSRLLKDCSHDNLLKTIREEFSEEISLGELNESNYYSRGKEYPMFVLSFSQSKQVLLKESKFVRKAVIQYIENLEQQLQKPLSVEEMIIKQAESMMQVKNDIQRLENKFDTVVTLESGKQRKIQLAVSKKVFKISGEESYGTSPILPKDYDRYDEHLKKIKKQLYSNIYRDIKRKFGVASYKDIKVVEYEKALNFIENWIEDVI